MADTKIAWAKKVWNPLSGCTHSGTPGCDFCYARELHTLRHRAFLEGAKLPAQYALPFSEIQFHPERLDQPLHWRKPARIFVNSMSDLFHEAVPFKFIDRVLAGAALCPQHTFLTLTKRAERMAKYFNGSLYFPGRLFDARNLDGHIITAKEIRLREIVWPLINLWLGVTAENQEQADRRIPLLLQVPAAVRFVSIEPCLGAVDISRWLKVFVDLPSCMSGDGPTYRDKLDWVIIGCESGPRRRPCPIEWVRDLVGQCRAASVPVFVKQLDIGGRVSHEPEEWPDDLRIREFPKGATS